MWTDESGNTFIIRLRRDNGWSQGDLAERLGVSQSCVSRWEAGKRKIPKWVGKFIWFGG